MSREARKYKKRIGVWQTITAPDGFGGFLPSQEVKITDTWAEIRTIDSRAREYNRADYGIRDLQNAIRVIVRLRKDFQYNNLNMYVTYGGFKWFIRTSPVNLQFTNSRVEFLAVRETSGEVPIIPPVGGEVFPYTFDFIMQ